MKMSTKKISWGLLRPMCGDDDLTTFMKIWEPKPPEPSGPHRACYGTALPLPLSLISLLGKGKAFPLQAWTGSELSRRLRLPDFNDN
jgi:hypothetical protein